MVGLGGCGKGEFGRGGNAVGCAVGFGLVLLYAVCEGFESGIGDGTDAGEVSGV